MAFFTERPKKFRKRNVEMGRETAAIGDTRRAEFARILQGQKNLGYTNVANIRQRGADRRLASEQEYGLPLQEQETEAARIGNVGEEFFQGLTKEFGPSFMRQELGLPEPVSRANVFFPDRRTPLEPKADLSSPRSGHTGSWEPDIPNILTSIGRKKKKDRTARPFSTRYGS